jgi:hypothetical protein
MLPLVCLLLLNLLVLLLESRKPPMQMVHTATAKIAAILPVGWKGLLGRWQGCCDRIYPLLCL